MQRPKVGVALGSGAAKGFAHVGVLKALTEHHIPIDVVTGSSMGSLIAAYYATGMKPDFMERLASSLGWRHWADFTVPKMGLIAGDKVRQMVAMLTRGLCIEQADIPLAIVATELLSKRSVTFTEGKISDAVRASVGIPGVFVPYVYGDGIYVDGGVSERVPVDAARLLGADIVVGVDVGSVQKSIAPENIMDVIVQSIDIMQDHACRERAKSANVYIEPDLTGVGSSHFHKAREAIAAGYEAASAAMPALVSLMSSYTNQSS